MSNSFVTPWTVTRQSPPSMGCPRQEQWRELPFPSLWIFLNQGSNPCLLQWQVGPYHRATRETHLLSLTKCILSLFLALPWSLFQLLKPQGFPYPCWFLGTFCWFSSVQPLSCVWLPQHTRPPCPSPTPRTWSDTCPSSRWCHQPPHPLLSPSPPAFNFHQHQGLYQRVSSSPQVTIVLEFHLQHQFFQGILSTDFL